MKMKTALTVVIIMDGEKTFKESTEFVHAVIEHEDFESVILTDVESWDDDEDI